MAVIISNPHLIDAPPPAALRYGLFKAATGPLALDTNGIRAGYTWFADHCDTVNAYNANCDTTPTKTPVVGSDLASGLPFWVYAYKKCGTVGRSPAEMQQAVRAQLLGGEQNRVEAVFWHADGGTLPGTTNLVDNVGTVVVVPAAPGFGTAIAALEEAFYSVNGYVGTIHVNTSAYAAAAYSQLIEGTPNTVLTTPIGSKWAFGAGYGTEGPGGAAAAAGFVWAFMTSQVIRWQGDIIVPPVEQTIDRGTNQYNALAERVHLLAWDCPEVFAVQVPVAAPATTAAPAVP